MSLKKTFQKQFGNAEKRIDVLYTSVKMVFIVLTLLFFLVYYFISARFFDEILTVFFLPLYLAFLMTFTLYLCAFTIKYFSKKLPRPIIMIVCGVILGGGAVFILPVL